VGEEIKKESERAIWLLPDALLGPPQQKKKASPFYGRIILKREKVNRERKRNGGYHISVSKKPDLELKSPYITQAYLPYIQTSIIYYDPLYSHHTVCPPHIRPQLWFV